MIRDSISKRHWSKPASTKQGSVLTHTANTRYAASECMPDRPVSSIQQASCQHHISCQQLLHDAQRMLPLLTLPRHAHADHSYMQWMPMLTVPMQGVSHQTEANNKTQKAQAQAC